MPHLVVNSQKCCGCRICEMSCSMSQLEIFNPRKALLRVEINRLPDPKTELSQIDVPVVCLQCDPAPCAEACLEGAIEETASGIWIVDNKKCTGCGLCVDACSYGVIKVDKEEGYARKCDLCGGTPICVECCPMGALTF
jgi:anaerobic carbon-monoxide dehydrogenase iron sulfur subunit